MIHSVVIPGLTESMAKSTISIGLAGEQAACEALSRLGFSILERNWRTKYCEVDIIAAQDNVLWFIEVKYRKTDSYGDGLDYIGRDKQMHMQRAAHVWVSQNNYEGEYTLGAMPVSGNNVTGSLVEL